MPVSRWTSLGGRSRRDCPLLLCTSLAMRIAPPAVENSHAAAPVGAATGPPIQNTLMVV